MQNMVIKALQHIPNENSIIAGTRNSPDVEQSSMDYVGFLIPASEVPAIGSASASSVNALELGLAPCSSTSPLLVPIVLLISNLRWYHSQHEMSTGILPFGLQFTPEAQTMTS